MSAESFDPAQQRAENRRRYMVDPHYYHAVRLIAFTVIQAIERADAEEEDGIYSAYHRRKEAALNALLDLTPVSLGITG